MPLDPKLLPSPAPLRRRTKALAMTEAIVCPEWESRYYNFNAAWGPAEEMAPMRNGSGDDWFLLFTPAGAGIKGLDHETELAGEKRLIEAVRQQVSTSLSVFLDEPAFGWDWMSYYYWTEARDSVWHRVEHPDPKLASAKDGSDEFLALLLEPSSLYLEFANWYYERSLPAAAVEANYRHAALTPTLVAELNPEASWEQVSADAAEIGYPVPQGDA
jgi:hypothetical protein